MCINYVGEIYSWAASLVTLNNIYGVYMNGLKKAIINMLWDAIVKVHCTKIEKGMPLANATGERENDWLSISKAITIYEVYHFIGVCVAGR